MINEYFISVTLDKRRKNKKGKYPVRLRVFTKTPREQKLFPTSFSFTEEEFNAIRNPTAPRSNELKALRDEYRPKLLNLESYASGVAEEMEFFTLAEFKKRINRESGDDSSVKYHFTEVIAEKRENGQIGSVIAYESSMKSLSDFVEQTKPFDKLSFYDVTVNWLEKYQKFMTDDREKSLTTVGVYLRQFRAVYKRAIASGDVPEHLYPFGNSAYKIPGGSSVNKALSREQMGTLINAKAMTPEQEKARDFWLFSYACSGMNIKDIALLRRKNIQGDKFSFIREKTKRTSTGDPVTIKVSLNDFSKGIIEKYSTGTSPNSYVFDIVDKGMTQEEVKRLVGNFTRFINQNLKKLCKANGLPEQVSVNWARHTHATLALRRGSSMEFVGSTLGHKNFATTERYFSGFEDEEIDKLAQNNMDF